MKPLTIPDAATMVLGLQDEIRRSEESRYDHRLHGVLLVAQGMTVNERTPLLYISCHNDLHTASKRKVPGLISPSTAQKILNGNKIQKGYKNNT